MNPNNKPRLLYSFSYTIPPVDPLQVKVNCLEEIKEALVEQLVEQGGLAEANVVIARIKAL